MPTWIDFRELRAKLVPTLVLSHYRIQLKVKGDQATGLCPLPSHPQRTDESKRTASFSINLTRGVWQCFGCKRSGNILDLACYMENADPKDGPAVRTVASRLSEAFGLDTRPTSPKQKQQMHKAPAVRGEASNPQASLGSSESTNVPVVVNPKLDFELKGLDPEHPYLKERGLTDETIRIFGLGFASRGMLKNRIAIALHNDRGELVGYAGRLTKDRDISDENPKYRFPSDREREGVRMVFKKSHLLFNRHRLKKPTSRLIVVEGFFSVFWLTQCGYGNAVALMGSDCSPEQAKHIAEITTEDSVVYFLTDGDDAGEACAISLFGGVGWRRRCLWLKLEHGKQPTDLTELHLSLLLE